VTRFIRSGVRRRLRLWVGFEHSPLCRPCDRLEARLRVLLVLVFMLAVPFVAWAAGAAVYRTSAHTEQSERSNRILVDAVLLAESHPVGVGFAAVPQVPVPAQWTAADGSQHSGAILVGVTAPAGAVVPIWTDRAGNIAEPPRGRDQTTMRTSVAAIVAGAGLALLLGGVRLAVWSVLNRRRMAGWDAEWTQVAPKWTEHR
jgi:hypothetical protein